MSAERRWRWTALLLGAAVLATGCAASRPAGRGAPLHQGPGSVPVGVSEVRGASLGAPSAVRVEAPLLLRRRGERVEGTVVAMASPAGVAARMVASGAVRVDAFEQQLLLAGLDEGKLPGRDAPLSPEEAARLLELLLNEPVTLGTFPPRMAVGYLLREVLEGGAVSREELLRRVERFNEVAVLRPDGYLAWTLSGRTQQVALGTLEWRDGAFRAGPLELGLFYVARSGVFRHADEQLRPVREGPPLAEVYDDADYISRTLDGAEEAFVELYHGLGQFLTRPTDGLAALVHVPEGVMALLASSPEYLERFRYMTRGEQVKVLARLTTQLFTTWGAASRTTRTLTGALKGAEVSVPVLSLSAQGTLALRRVAVPVGKAATALGGGPGAAIFLHQMGGDGNGGGGSTSDYVRFGANGNGIVAAIDKDGIVEMAIAAPKGSPMRGSELFDGMMKHFGENVRAIRGNWRYGDNLAEVNRLVGQGMAVERAVENTWTARRAAEYGFVKAVVIELKGSPGAYSFVQVLFAR